MSWRDKFVNFDINVLASLVASVIFLVLSRAYPTLKKYLFKAIAASRTAGSKISSLIKNLYSSLTEISFFSRENQFISFFVDVFVPFVLAFAANIVYPLIILISINVVGNVLINKQSSKSFAVTQSAKCNCPIRTNNDSISISPVTFTSGRHASNRISEYTRKYDMPSKYSKTGSFSSNVTAKIYCLEQEGKKSKRTTKSGMINTNATGKNKYKDSYYIPSTEDLAY